MTDGYSENLKELIIEIRGQSVLLDSDVADLYGAETKRINEAVKNNPDKFPDGYIMELDKSEWDSLKPKFSTSIKGGKVKLPSVFTEKSCICWLPSSKARRQYRQHYPSSRLSQKSERCQETLKSYQQFKTKPTKNRSCNKAES